MVGPNGIVCTRLVLGERIFAGPDCHFTGPVPLYFFFPARFLRDK